MTVQTNAPLFAEILRDLHGHVSSGGDLWPRFLAAGVKVTGGADGVVFRRDSATGELEPIAWAPNGGSVPPPEPLADFREFALRAERNGSSVGGGADDRGKIRFVGTRVETAASHALAVIRLHESASDDIRSVALGRLEVAAAAAAASQLRSEAASARLEAETFAGILDLCILLDEATTFTAAAMLLCNQLAARYGAERVSLGWLRGRYIRLEAISHSDRFEAKSAAATALAAAMEETLDADEEIILPAEPDAKTVSRFHAAFAREQGIAHLASIPLRTGTEPCAVVTLERAARPFDVAELRSLRLAADHAARRLEHLRQLDRWVGARVADWARTKTASLLGPQHTGAKLVALTISLVLLVLVFGRATYRVESPFTLRSDTLAFLPAPFDGYIDEVHFRIGDGTAAGQPLVSLSRRELLLEESAAAAEQNAFLAEAQKAQSVDNIAEMQIALAKAEQSRARLDRTRYHLSQAEIKAPFAGVVIEGDLRERVGAPVKQGETLLKLGRLTDLYAEAEVGERSIHELGLDAVGEIAFASRPELKFPVRVERIEPAATASDKGNNFIVRCHFPSAQETWWRPGMTGICKLDAGQRSLLWILTHRTVEFLRMQLWW